MGTSNRHFRELDVYKMAIESAIKIFEITKLFPADGKLVSMLSHPEQWAIHNVREEGAEYA